MPNRSHRTSRAGLVAALAFVTFTVSVPAIAQAPQAKPPAVAIFKGDYAFTDVQLCHSGQSSQITSLATFNTTSGTVKINGYIATGDPLTLTKLKQTLSYSNSATTFTFGETVYQVTYGKLANGIATYATMIAAQDPCAAQLWLSRQ